MNTMKKMLCPLVIAGMMASASAVELVRGKNGEFSVSAKRVKVAVRNARIVGVESKDGSNKIVDPSNGVDSVYAGLGNMRGKVKELSRVHYPWGEPNVRQHKKRIKTDIYRYPDEKSELMLEELNGKITATWKNLTNGTARFAQDTITLVFSLDKKGALTIGRAAASPDPGIFGLNIPVENLGRNGKILIPSFGGMEYDAFADEEQLMSFQNTGLFIEAPLMIYAHGGDTMAIWIEDANLRPYFGLIERTPQGATMALEALNLMPYETNTIVTAPALKLDLFADSDWVAAARPYRDWYQQTFAKEIAVRESIEWARKIYVIADGGAVATGAENIPKLFNPENVLIQIWQPRKEGFTTNIPDYTPRDGYAATVNRLHELKLKVMCYVCTLCAVYRSPAWDRDNVGDFFLTRKNTITNYGGNENAFDENLIGTIRAARGKDQYADLKPGAFLYGDPLSTGWRRYFIKVIKEMNELCGTDANYQDTLGCTGDTGNGIVDGLAGAEGNKAFTRELQEGLGVPMAAEYGPAPIAFGIRWPLNHAVAWGGDKFRSYRVSRQHPITPFLFGYRSWVSTVRMYTDELKYTGTAVSDSLSGFGMFSSNQPMRTEKGFDDHLIWRAKVFADNRLEPYYPEKKYPPNIRAMYRDFKGGIYQYYDDGTLQKMIGPDGKVLYGRLHGAAELKTTEFVLKGWPINDDNGIYGLDLTRHYALFPASETSSKVRFSAIPTGVSLKTYYETPDFSYMKLDGENGAEIELPLSVANDYSLVIVNDAPQAVNEKAVVKGKLPLRLVFTNGKNTRPDTIRRIGLTSGLEDGASEGLPAPRKIAGSFFYIVNGYACKNIDYIHNVKTPEEALDFKLVNTQTQYGDGAIVRVFINGKLIREFNCAKWNGKGRKTGNNYVFDNRIRNWRIPIGKYVGKPILVTVAVDYKNGSNADMQFVTIPNLVNDTQQEFVESFIEEKQENAVRPKGKPLATIIPEFNLKDNIKPVTTSTAISKDFYSFEPGKRYFLSGEFKGEGKLHFGVIEYNENGVIYGTQINPIPDSESLLQRTSPAGSKILHVFDTANWVSGMMVALDVKSDYSDLPNRKLVGPIEKMELKGGEWGVFLANPLKETVITETKVRVHMPRSSYEYVKTVQLNPNSFVRAEGMISVWPGAKKFKVLILNKNNQVELKNLKLEVFAPKK